MTSFTQTSPVNSEHASARNPEDAVKSIAEFMAPAVRRVDEILCQSLDSESDLIREVGDYIAFTRGKKLRPMLAMLMTKTLAPDAPAPVEVAAAIELIHVATLVHDDVIDKASMRRGRASVNAKWGDEVAILMADYLYAHAFDLALTSLKPEVMRVLCGVTKRMCEGEMFQLRLDKREFTLEDYYHVIERKTGSLFAASASLGALLAGGSPDQILAARGFGNDFGMAFQITDDALDYVAHDQQWGKDIGMDASGGKQTLPLLLALAEATPEDRAFIEGWTRNGHGLDDIVKMIDRYQGVERAMVKARGYAKRANESLQAMGHVDSPGFEQLASLAPYVVSRAY